MCREVLDDRHGHVVEIEQRSIVCACRACYLLFLSEGAAGGKYRSVPERVRHDPGTPLDDADWVKLQIPVAMAFFFFNSVLGRVVAGYPSPGGVTECELDLAAWDRLVAAYPLFAAMTPDVEAVFVSTAPNPAARSLPAPDRPVLLAGRRASGLRWQGFDGGAEAHARAGVVPGSRPAVVGPGADARGAPGWPRPGLRLHGRERGTVRGDPYAVVRGDDNRELRGARPRDRPPLPDPHRTAATAVLRSRGEAAARPVR